MKRSIRHLILCLCTTALAAHVGHAQVVTGDSGEDGQMNNAVRVEEDWVVLVQNPDPATCAPQIVNMMSPDPATESSFGLFEINHGSSPSFMPGGFQVQAFQGDYLVNKRNSLKHQVLSKGYDKFTYTTVMKIENGQLKYKLKNGKSRTWGRFATATEDLFAAHSTQKTNLGKYLPTHSVENTSVNVGAHRVGLMAQKEVRWFGADGKLLKTDTTVRYPHRYTKTVQDVTFAQYMADLDELYSWEITD